MFLKQAVSAVEHYKSSFYHFQNSKRPISSNYYKENCSFNQLKPTGYITIVFYRLVL